MKKLAIIICFILCLFTSGCAKKVKCEVDEVSAGIWPRYSSDDSTTDRKSIYDVLGFGGCYLFKSYEEFDNILNEYDLVLKEKIASKYTSDFFIDKALIICFGIDPSGGYKWKFNIYKEDSILKLEVYKSLKDNGTDVEVDRMFFIDIYQEKITNTNEFDFHYKISN